MSTRPLFFIVDGHALAYRHYFAQIKRPLMTSKGEPTSAIFGFSRTLMDIIEKDKPYYLAVAFDEGLSGRDLLYADYKGTREKMPDDLRSQIEHIQSVVRAFNIPILALEGYEADDLIGTVARQAEAQGIDVRIITGDRDLLQLLTPHTTVRLAIPQPGVPDELVDVSRFIEKYALQPTQLIDLKALEGDTSDNIPGVAGIGRKGATTLLQQYGTLDGIYEHLDELKEGVRNKLIAGKESAYLSYQLASIRQDVPFDLALAACVAHDFDKRSVEELFRTFEFTSMFNQLGRLGARNTDQLPLFDLGKPESKTEELFPSEPVTEFPYEIVTTQAQLDALVAELNNAKLIAFDTETTDTDQMRADLVGISVAYNGEKGYYIPVGHLEGEQRPLAVVLEALRPSLTNPNIDKIAHNAVYDLVVLANAGLDVTPITFDTMVASWLADSVNGELGLKRLAKSELDVTMIQISELIGKGKQQKLMSEVSIEQASPYAAADAVVTYQLYQPMLEKIDIAPLEVDPLWGTKNPPTPYHMMKQIEMPMIPVIAHMERTGVLLDIPYLQAMGSRLNDMLRVLEEEIYGLSGGYGAFNINSPKQLNDVLFGKLGLKPEGVRKTTHGYSTAADVLDSMRDLHPIIEKILNYREVTKLKGTYVDALPVLVNPRTGRVHTSFNITGSSTGRMSSNNPNLQNIPIRTDLGREIRRAFIVDEGSRLLSVDYSQVELRIMAHIASEPYLIEAFQQGQDIHAATAAVVNNIPIENVTKSLRSFAKRVNFGLLYGMGAFRLARESDLTHAEAAAFIETYFSRLPGVKAYLEKAKQLAKDEGYLTTLFGRRRSFPGLRHGNRNLQQQAEREAINMPIQGTAADIIKLAMIDLYAELPRRGLSAKMILQVHDELVFEVPADQLQETAALVVEKMEGVIELAAPLRCNAQFGMDWYDMEAI